MAYAGAELRGRMVSVSASQHDFVQGVGSNPAAEFRDLKNGGHSSMGVIEGQRILNAVYTGNVCFSMAEYIQRLANGKEAEQVDCSRDRWRHVCLLLQPTSACIRRAGPYRGSPRS
jgi:hypothetical protein